MKRRDFLKLLGIAPLAPSVLAKTELLELSNEAGEIRETEEFGWSNGRARLVSPLYGYHYVKFDYYGETDPPSTCEVFGSIDGSSCEKIGNCAIARQGVGIYEITIPEGVL